MAEQDDPASAALRLEQALDRIARFVHAPQPAAEGVAAEAGPDMAQIAARIDRLIAELRAALGQSADAGH